MMLFPVTLNEPNCPKPPYLVIHICIAFRVFIMGGVRKFTFGRLTDQRKF